MSESGRVAGSAGGPPPRDFAFRSDGVRRLVGQYRISGFWPLGHIGMAGERSEPDTSPYPEHAARYSALGAPNLLGTRRQAIGRRSYLARPADRYPAGSGESSIGQHRPGVSTVARYTSLGVGSPSVTVPPRTNTRPARQRAEGCPSLRTRLGVASPRAAARPREATKGTALHGHWSCTSFRHPAAIASDKG